MVINDRVGTKVYIYPLYGSRPTIERVLQKDEDGFYVYYNGKRYVKPVGEGTFKILPFELK